MKLFGGVIPITGITFLMFVMFVIICIGYALGRITIKGIALETAGVFVIALLTGALFSSQISATVTQTVNGEAVDISGNALKVIENMGLMLFVTSVGFIAGPNFFSNFKKNFKSYVLIGFVIIVSGALITLLCFFIGKGGAENPSEFLAILIGVMAGSLTSTPAFSAAKASVGPELEAATSVGYGIAYLYGVIGVVLFVQIMPKLLKVNMEEEVKKITAVETGTHRNREGRIKMDEWGLGAFALAVLCGILIGNIKIPLTGNGLSGTCFSLTATGGTLLAGLIFGHLGKIGAISVTPDKGMLKVLRELGLVLFLMGAGIPGGMRFVQYFRPVYFLYGFLVTTIPMFIGFLLAYKLLKLPLLNCLGSITGGMTSTPALGTLISVAKSEEVASAYAATYPIALICVVLAAQFLGMMI